VPAGSYRVTVAAPGFLSRARDVLIRAGNNSASFLLRPANAYAASGNTLVYLPPTVSTFRGAVVVVHGGTSDSRPMLEGDIDYYRSLPPSGDVSGYRDAVRAFAKAKDFAVVAMKTPAVSESGNMIASDILSGLTDAANSRGHPELANAPLVLQGMSNGGCAVHKIVAEIPNRVIGFISMKAPAGCGFPGSSAFTSVPGYFFLGELDTRDIADFVTTTFEQKRARGAVWALAIERGAGHVWVRSHAMIFSWAAVVAAQRLPATVTPGAPVALREVGESSGWLGDRTSFSIAGYSCFTGDKTAASWLPSEQTAREWQSMMGFVTTVVPCP